MRFPRQRKNAAILRPDTGQNKSSAVFQEKDGTIRMTYSLRFLRLAVCPVLAGFGTNRAATCAGLREERAGKRRPFQPDNLPHTRRKEILKHIL